jgi:hypothetical protein
MEATEKQACALCNQPVAMAGFSQQDADGVKKFCCAGCLSIFRLLYQHHEPTTLKTKNNNEETP